MNQELINKLEFIVHKLQAYHRHEVKGIEHIPEEGPALIVCNHSLATYDIALLAGQIKVVYGRICRSLVDRLFFKIPFLGELMEASGAVAGNRDAAKNLLLEGHLVTVAPGGMRESLRPSDERYQVLWEKRRGFAQVAFETGSPVILAACPKADDLYTVYENPITKWAYRKWKIPLFLAHGLGPTPIPKPVKLVHFLSEPIYPPKPASTEAARKKQVAQYHAKLIKRMRELIGEAIAYRG